MQIKKKLMKCPFLNPFIIEEHASHKPSNQFYQREVARCNIYVLLVKGVVRPGTLKEYALAEYYKKPALIYFLDDAAPNSKVRKLKDNLIRSDYCTFKGVSDFKSIDITVWQDIMENLVRDFLDKDRSPDNSNDIVNAIINKENMLLNLGSLSKEEIGKFSSCYNILFDLVNMHFYVEEIEKSEWHDLGCSLIQWLITGLWDVKRKDIEKLIEYGNKELFSSSKWLRKRWNAITALNQGNIEKAFSEEKLALKYAREANEPSWIINNILIDCRNIQLEIDNLKHIFRRRGNYQEELDSLKTMVCLPVADRYLSNIYSCIEKDEFREKTASPYTELFGSNLSYALTDLANYMFVAAIYGSNTHLLIAHKTLAYIMDHYYELSNNPEMAFIALKQFVLLGGVKDFELYIKKRWDHIYSFITSNADELWKMTELTRATHRDAMKIAVFDNIGLYFSDPVFKEAEQYLIQYSNEVKRDNSDGYFKAILHNLIRFNSNRIVSAIIPLIKMGIFVNGWTISHIIMYMNIDKVSKKNLLFLADALKDRLPFIIAHNGDPQMLVALMKRSKDIFGELETIEGNGLVGFQRDLYNINMGSNDWESVLKTEIKNARSAFNESKKNKGVILYGDDPYFTISKIIREYVNDDIINKLIIRELIPLSNDVLNSEVAVHIKLQCVACLCEIFGYFRKNNRSLPNTLKKTLQIVDASKGNDHFFSNNRKMLEIRLIMAKILAGIDDIDSLLQWCIEFGNLDIKEKVVIVNCIEQYLFYKMNQYESISSLLLSIVLQCSAEDYEEIRCTAVKCLAYISRHSQYEIALVALNKAIYDPSVRVRMTLLNLCKSDILPTDVANKTIRIFQNDANYTIRKKARERKKTITTQ